MLLLLLFSITAATICNETNFRQFYFDLCSADMHCSYNFDLHADEFAFFAYLMESEMLVPRNLTWVDICDSPNSAVLWLADLRVQPLCLPNQLRDPELGCIARSDRTETRFVFTIVSELGLLLLQLIILGIVLYICFKLFKEIDGARLRPKLK